MAYGKNNIGIIKYEFVINFAAQKMFQSSFNPMPKFYFASMPIPNKYYIHLTIIFYPQLVGVSSTLKIHSVFVIRIVIHSLNHLKLLC